MRIVQNCFDSWSSGSLREACVRSNLVNFLPPAKASKISSALGRGYWSTLKDWLTVTLKSPQRRTLPSGLGTATMGVAHSVWVTSRIPSRSNPSN